MSIKALLGSLMMGVMLMFSCCNGDSCKKDGAGHHCDKSDSTKCCKGDSTKCDHATKCAADCQKACCKKEDGAHKCAHADSVDCAEACHAAVADSTVMEDETLEEVEGEDGHEEHNH
ncbi:MAG: hypothetical protein ACJA0Q_001635 [Saprospiraceae bacterium]|jgi:hypothetical protein